MELGDLQQISDFDLSQPEVKAKNIVIIFECGC